MMAVERVAVIGAGTMGQGIAYVALASGRRVTLLDADARTLSAGVARIRGSFDKGIERGKVTSEQRDAALARLETPDELASAVHRADLIVEAVPERLELKREVFTAVERNAPADAILASNTSSLSITSIAAALDRPAQLIGMHFFNPVPVMRLVELVRGAATSDAIVERSREFARSLGKTPIVVRDSPGFATSRLGVVLGLEAIRMLEQGVATAEDIDSAMELGYNHPMGPLKLTDVVGLDIRLAIAEHLHSTLKDDTYRPPGLLRSMVSEGKLGKKTGQGFYRWESER